MARMVWVVSKSLTRACWGRLVFPDHPQGRPCPRISQPADLVTLQVQTVLHKGATSMQNKVFGTVLNWIQEPVGRGAYLCEG